MSTSKKKGSALGIFGIMMIFFFSQGITAIYPIQELLIGVFPDVSQTAMTYVEAVNAIVSAGIMNGTTATTFEPNTTANRGMVATVILRLHNLLED